MPVLAVQLDEMNETRKMSRIRSSDELVSFVRARRQKLAGCYERLATEMAQFGETKLEAIYRLLAGDAAQPDVFDPESRIRTPENSRAYVPLPANTDPPDVASLSTPYAIWAFAVSNEILLFEELAAANISVLSSHLQSELAVEARACLDRAALYRAQRRLAFHAERLSEEIAQFPDIRRIDSEEDFAHVALAIERYFQGLLMSYESPSRPVGDVIALTSSAVSFLEPVARDAPMSKRLKRPLQRLARVTQGQAGNNGKPIWGVARIALEADRIFDYYDRVFESALDPQVLAAAQRLSDNILCRLRALRGQKDSAAASGQAGG